MNITVSITEEELATLKETSPNNEVQILGYVRQDDPLMEHPYTVNLKGDSMEICHYMMDVARKTAEKDE